MLACCPKPRTDIFPLAPGIEPLAPELLALVTDQALGRCLGLMDQPSQEGAGVAGSGRVLEHGKAHGATGEVVDHHGNPVAEGPALKQTVGKPGGPKSPAGWNQSQIDMPDMIDSFGPGTNGVGRDEEDLDGLFQGPSSDSAELEDRHAFGGGIVRSPLRIELRHADIL